MLKVTNPYLKDCGTVANQLMYGHTFRYDSGGASVHLPGKESETIGAADPWLSNKRAIYYELDSCSCQLNGHKDRIIKATAHYNS